MRSATGKRPTAAQRRQEGQNRFFMEKLQKKVTVSAAFKAAAPASENLFTDVPSSAYYEDAVVWAVKKDIIYRSVKCPPGFNTQAKHRKAGREQAFSGVISFKYCHRLQNSAS